MIEIIDVVDEIKDHPSKSYPERPLSDINGIDIHHSGSDIEDGMRAIQIYNKSHIEDRGWAGIGYHNVVSMDGKVYKTRLDREMGWSVGGNNSYTISVLLVGDFSNKNPSEIQYESGLKIVERLRQAYGIPVKDVKGHHEFPNNATVCPGFNMDEFRNKLEKL